MDERNETDLATLTSEIVSAYVANNSVPATDLPEMIRSIYQTLGTLGQAPAPVAEAEPAKPAVPIKKSITDEYLISLFDGRKFKSLKRHLSTEHGMTPADYRALFGLPNDYPMVAPAYAKHRSSLAKSLGLGRRAPGAEASPEMATKPEHEPPKKRSRTKTAA